MNQAHSIRDQSCPNEKCPHFEQKNGQNIWVHSLKKHRFRCKVCSKTWVTHIKKPTYRLRRQEDHLQFALFLLRNGLSTRQVSRRLKASPSTIQRWKSKVS